MASKMLGSLLLLFQTSEDPTNPEWEHCLGLLRAFNGKLDDVRVLVMTHGGGPSPYQRKRLAEVLGKAKIRVAIVTDSMRVRIVTSTVAFIIPRIRSFASDRMHEACAHLGLSRSEQGVAQLELAELSKLVTP
jgi:hypothetical protein